MKDIVFIHTNWTKPALNSRWNIDSFDQILNNIWYYSLSTAYLKKIGQRIELHTDDFGEKCLNHIPYDKINLTLNSIPTSIKPYIWAFGKFWALNQCPLNTVHIDADVFIKSNKCINKLHSLLENSDAVFQCHEFVTNINDWPYPIYKSATDAIAPLRYPKWANVNGQDAYNTGLIIFNNVKYKTKFINEYFNNANECSVISDIVKTCENNAFICPDLVIEQQFIFDMANYKNYNIGLLINWPDCKNSANEIGYQHVIGKEKYNSVNMDRCKQVLFSIDRVLYDKTVKKCKEIESYLYETKHIKRNILRS